MANINFTSALKRFYPNLTPQKVDATNIAEALQELNKRFPNICEYILDEQGALRKHVNIYIGENLILDRQHLSDTIKNEDEILIFQALSGG